MNVIHTFLLGGGAVINTTAYHLGRYSLQILLLKSSMVCRINTEQLELVKAGFKVSKIGKYLQH